MPHDCFKGVLRSQAANVKRVFSATGVIWALRQERRLRAPKGLLTPGTWESKTESKKRQWGIILNPSPHIQGKIVNIWPQNCRVCLVSKHLGSSFVQVFVLIFASYVGDGGHSRVSESEEVRNSQVLALVDAVLDFFGLHGCEATGTYLDVFRLWAPL